MEQDDIIIRKAVIHILDSKTGIPVLSDSLLELTSDLNDFIRAHIYKIISSDDLKECAFNQEDSVIYQYLQDFKEENLVEISQKISQHLYTILNQNIEIPSADFFVVTFQLYGIMRLALLKMNYKETYIHMTGNDNNNAFNTICKQTATLPSASSRLSEAVLVNLSDYTIHILEKKYEINGEKINYLSQIFLQCQTKLSEKAKMSIVTKTVEQINEKYFQDNFDKHMQAKSVLKNELAEQGAIYTEVLGEKIYGDIPEIKEEFIKKLEKHHIQEDEIKPQSKQTAKKLEKQFLTTDTGIEINIPMEQYQNSENVEFITNPDGTISVLIKNISHITTK